MPEHEFEIYLSVLSRLLKLTPEQTASIEDELRDHLEERFEELVRSGVERDEAIRQALDEFGDASGLAVDLTRVSQKPIRRWVIGSSIVTVAALLVGAMFFLMSEPDAASLPGATTAVAQTQPETPQPIDPQSLFLDQQPDDLELAQLSEPCSIDFPPDTPIRDAMDYLAEQHKVPIILDPLMLLDGIVTPDQPLNVPPLGHPKDAANTEPSSNWPHEPTLAQLLDVMLAGLDLTWYVKDRIIIVTTVDLTFDRTREMTRSYNIEPLINAGISAETITYVLESNTNGMWEEFDGIGTRISLVGNVLTIRQTYQVQREVRRLLIKLAQPGDSPWIDYAAERESLAALLKRQYSLNFPTDTPLNEFLDTISRELSVPILLDPLMLLDGVVTEDQPINMPSIGAAPLEAVFRLGLEEIDLVLVLKNGLPTVTTDDIANDPSRLAIAVYDVGPFVDAGVDTWEFSAALQRMAGGEWQEIDGDGGCLTLVENGLLVVSQTDEVHRSLQQLLETWGKGLKNRKPPVPVSTAPVTKFYHMPIETAESLKTVLPEMVAPETWTSDDNSGGGTIQVIALAQKPVRAAEPEKQDVDPAEKSEKKPDAAKKTAWNGAGGPFVFAQFGGGGGGFGGGGGLGGGQQSSSNGLLDFYSESTGVLVITQTPAVHREIDRFLASLRVSTRGRNEATEAEAAANGFGGGMGGGFF